MAGQLKKRPKISHGPLWDWTSGITQSGLTQFLACREQFALGYVEGWSPRSFSTALEFGSMIHFMLEKQFSGQSPESIAREVTKSYYETRKKTIDATSHDDLNKNLAAAEALFPNYVDYWKEYDSKISWLKREHVFRFPHKFLDFQGITREIELVGMRDGDYRNTSSSLGLFETKTKSQIDDTAIQTGLRADMQTMMYLLSLRREYLEEPAEILYNVIRRPQLIQKKTESLQDYAIRISEDIKKRPEWYFRRYEVTVLPGDVETFVQTTLDPVLAQLWQWWEEIKENPLERWSSPYHFRNLTALTTRYGKAPLYNLMIMGRTNEYFHRSSPFPELNESLATLL